MGLIMEKIIFFIMVFIFVNKAIFGKNVRVKSYRKKMELGSKVTAEKLAIMGDACYLS